MSIALLDNIRRARTFLALAVLLVLAHAVLLLLVHSPATPLLPPDAHWQVAGTFVRDAAYLTTTLPPRFPAAPALWGSWAGADANTGQLTSPPFTSPEFLLLYVAGYPDRPANGIFLERMDTSTRLRLHASQASGPGEHWQRQVWQLPPAWRHLPVHLIARDGETSLDGWLGISAPSSLTWFAFYRAQLPELRILPLYTFDFCLFLLPGLALALALNARRALAPLHTLAIVLAASALSGYLAFWIYFFNKSAGRNFSLLLEILSLVAASLLLLRRTSSRRLLKCIAAPLLASFACGLFYLCIFYLSAAPSASGSDLPATRFFSERRPPDNEIPLFFANRLYRREPLKPFLGDWLSSDRPPLQSGIFLLQRPFQHAADSSLHYQLLATALQALWVCAAWAILYALGTSPRSILQTIALLALSGFLFFNTVYVWPKLLAASFLLLLLALASFRLRNPAPFSAGEGLLAGTCFSLALLSHPGSLFSTPALLILLLHPRTRPLLSWRSFAPAAVVTLTLLLPWSVYQQYFDPPANRLLKWHLGGQVDPDSRSTWQTISDGYRRLTPRALLAYKSANLRNIIGPHPATAFGLPPIPREAVRIETRKNIWSALGLLHLGWIFAASTLVRRSRLPSVVPHAGLLLAAALVNLFVWSLALFGPGVTLTDHASYADMLLLAIGLSGFLLALPRAAVAVLFALQAVGFAVFWTYTPGANSTPSVPAITPLPQLPLAGVAAILFIAGLVWVLRTQGPGQTTRQADTL